jgi:hypothetical protein
MGFDKYQDITNVVTFRQLSAAEINFDRILPPTGKLHTL